jgi:asparagine synthase (glutamine-hydrolysing)
VPPAGLVSIGGAGAAPAVARYWSPALLPKLRLSEEEDIAGIHDRLRRAVEIWLRSEVRVGCFLSGGIDSGLVTELAAEASSTPLRTYSIGFTDDAFDERGAAALVAERFGTKHVELTVEPAVAA